MEAKELEEMTEKQQLFLIMLAQIPNVTRVCNMVECNRASIYKTRKRNEQFKKLMDEALEEGYDLLEEEARRRAVDGVEEPVFYRGTVVGHVQKFSDNLLVQLLRAYRAKKFAPKQVVDVKAEGEKVIMNFNMGGDADSN